MNEPAEPPVRTARAGYGGVEGQVSTTDLLSGFLVRALALTLLAATAGPIYFRLLCFLGQQQVIAHGILSCLWISTTDGAINCPVHLCGLFQVVSAPDRLAPRIQEHGGYHIHQRCQDAISGSGSYHLMKIHVV